MAPRPARSALSVGVAVVLAITALVGPASAQPGGEQVTGELLRVLPETGTAAGPGGTVHAAPSDEAMLLLDTAEGILTLEPTPELARVATGTTVTVSVDDAAVGGTTRVLDVVDVRDVEQTVGTAGAQPAATSTAHRAYVVVVSDPTVEGDFTQTSATALTKKAAAYWVTQSRGAISGFTQAAIRTRTISGSCALDAGALWTRAAAAYPGVVFSSTSRNHLIVYSPIKCSYAYAGLATVSDTRFASGGYVHVTHDALGVLAHELGHNLSLGHSNLVTTSPTSSVFEYWALFGPQQLQYGDYHPGTLDAAYRSFLRVPDSARQTRTVRWGASTTQALSPVTSVTGTTAIKFKDPSTGVTYFLELRAGGGGDTAAMYADPAARYGFDFAGQKVVFAPGVRVTRLQGNAIETVTQRVGGEQWVTVRAGETYRAADGAFGFQVVSATRSGAVVRLVTGGTTGIPAPVTRPADVSYEIASPLAKVASSTTVTATQAAAGKPVVVKVKVTAARTVGGFVTLYAGTTKIADATVVGGIATFSTTRPRGAVTFTATYTGNPEISASSGKRAFTVR